MCESLKKERDKRVRKRRKQKKWDGVCLFMATFAFAWPMWWWCVKEENKFSFWYIFSYYNKIQCFCFLLSAAATNRTYKKKERERVDINPLHKSDVIIFNFYGSAWLVSYQSSPWSLLSLCWRRLTGSDSCTWFWHPSDHRYTVSLRQPIRTHHTTPTYRTPGGDDK